MAVSRRATLHVAGAAALTPFVACRGADRSESASRTSGASRGPTPLPVVHEVPVDAPVQVSDKFLGLHAHRWPGGGSRPPSMSIGTVRSLNYDPRDDARGVHWCGIQTGPERFDWSVLDRWVDTHARAGRDLMYTVYGTPTWVSFRPAKADPYDLKGGNSRPTDLGALYQFVRALVGRYNGDGRRRLRYVEAWNEPDFPSDYWLDGPNDLAQVMRTVHEAAKTVDRGITVVWPGFVNWIGEQESVPRVHSLYRRFAEAPDGQGGRGGDWGDAIAFHYYATRPDIRQFVDHQESMLATRRALGQNAKPILLTEIGFDATVGDKVPLSTKVALIRRWIALSAAYGNGFIGLYSYESATHLGDPHGDPLTAVAIDEIGRRVSGATIRRAALLADGSAWLELEKGETLRI
jgi:hypothetical protein